MIITHFNGKKIRYVKQVNDECLFLVRDAVSALVDTKDATDNLHESVKKRGSQVFGQYVQQDIMPANGNICATDTLGFSDLLALLKTIKGAKKRDLRKLEAFLNNIVYSKSSYILKHKNISVVEIEINDGGEMLSYTGIINEPHLPVGTMRKNIFNFYALSEWWRGRTIPVSRRRLKDFLDQLGLYFPQQLLTKSLGLSLSDQYWICPTNINIRWEDVNFFQNPFSEDLGNILLDEVEFERGKEIDLMTPDNTCDGLLTKKWAIIDGKRYLMKGSNRPFKQEVANEILASLICERLGIPHVKYDVVFVNEEAYSICEDFISEKTELVPAWYIKKLIESDNSVVDYECFLSKVEELGISDIRLRMDQMLTLDFLIANVDRHYNNFGLLRDAENLEYISFAPIYDSGNSMWCMESEVAISGMDDTIKSKPFKNKHINQIVLVKDFSWLNLDALDGIEIEFLEILNNTIIDGSSSLTRNLLLTEALTTRVKMLKGIIAKQINLQFPG
ncbi:MAG: excisionase [Christensenellaceae bacterium]|jgi:hypothetical protein|nr:excisionase [Christensenellaceae bacterium]